MKEHLKNTVVIGGGIIGAMTAYFLQNQGWKVTIIEQDRFGNGCSHGNCGLIHPSHVLPLSMPGAVLKALKWMFKKDAPLYFKPRFDMDMIRWMIRFSLNCTQRDMFHSAAGRHYLLHDAIDLYETIIKKENIFCDWQNKGALYVFKSKQSFKKQQLVDQWIKQFIDDGKQMGSDETHEIEPSLKKQIAGSWYYRTTRHLRPDLLMQALKKVLLKKGVRIIEGTQALSFIMDKRTARAVDTDKGNIEADIFVLATGAWIPLTNMNPGCEKFIQPGKGYSITMEKTENNPSIPCILEEARVVATPFKETLRLGGTMEFSGYNKDLVVKRLEALVKNARDYFHSNNLGNTQEEWYGWRPMTYDGLPVIDFHPEIDNVVVAVGHNMLGLSMGPATGKLVAQILENQAQKAILNPYRINRF